MSFSSLDLGPELGPVPWLFAGLIDVSRQKSGLNLVTTPVHGGQIPGAGGAGESGAKPEHCPVREQRAEAHGSSRPNKARACNDTASKAFAMRSPQNQARQDQGIVVSRGEKGGFGGGG